MKKNYAPIHGNWWLVNRSRFSMPFLFLKDLSFHIGKINLRPQLLSGLKTWCYLDIWANCLQSYFLYWSLWWSMVILYWNKLLTETLDAYIHEWEACMCVYVCVFTLCFFYCFFFFPCPFHWIKTKMKWNKQFEGWKRKNGSRTGIKGDKERTSWYQEPG